ncbi:hypothetical protein GEMRC1_013767 [Eukaryota sp. GEM-RC1]
MRSVYVGDLNRRTTEAELIEVFSQVGEVTSVKIPKNRIDGSPLGYAYVNFQTPEEAQKALEMLNDTPFHGKPCRIMFAESNPQRRKTPLGNLFIKNLHPDITNKELRDVFSKFGTILSCKISTDEDGNSLGYGYVHFQTSEEAQDAINHMHAKPLALREDPSKSSVIEVQKFAPAQQRFKMIGGVRASTNIFLKNLPPLLTEETFKQHLSEFGEVKSFTMKLVPDFNRKIGFADFENIEAATKAVKQLHESTTFGDEPIYVSFFQPRKIRKSLLQRQFQNRVAELKAASKNRNLWVGNLPESFTSDQLKTAFEPYGAITSAIVQKTAGGVSKQFGFVCFENESDAKAALKAMNAKQIDPSMPPLKVCMFRTKAERDQYKAKLEQYRNFATRQPVMTRKPHYFPPTQRPYRPTIPGLAHPQEVFTKGARNVSGDYVTATPVAAVPVPVPAAVVTIPTVVEEGAEAEHREKLRFIEMLNNLPDDEQKKEELGERLYPVIEARQPEHAAKITGMFLAMDNIEDIIELYMDEKKLEENITEAMEALLS